MLVDFEAVVKKRRMCREYLDRDVPQEKLDRILDLGSRYPSAGHTEPQEFVVVRDQRVKEVLARAALDQTFVARARWSSSSYRTLGGRRSGTASGAYVSSASSMEPSSRCSYCSRL